MRRFLALTATAVAMLASAAPASAAPSDPFQFKFFFDTADLPGGFNAGQVQVNHATGNVLVHGAGKVFQFDSNGNPLNFSATGSPIISVGGETMYVDNSGGSTQGNIYVTQFGFGSENIWAFKPNGEALPGSPYFPLNEGNLEGFQMGFTVGPDGTLWVLYSNWNDGTYRVKAFGPNGKPTGIEKPLSNSGGLNPAVMDDFGNLYTPGNSTFRKYAPGSFANLGETGLQNGARTAIDPSTNDLYLRANTRVFGVHYSDPLVSSTPFEALGGLFHDDNSGLAFDATGQTLYIAEYQRLSAFHREPSLAPWGFDSPDVDRIRAMSAAAHGRVIAGGAPTSVHFEYSTDTSYDHSTPEVQAPFGHFPVAVEAQLEGLEPGTTYHVRQVATNSVGTTYGPERVFTTYSIPPGGPDPCPNALARKQTGARTLPDCRAYELVSASDTGGYDVESHLVPGQEPFPGYPEANDRILYATHAGAVPGPWNATNKGPDPYLATRGEDGWDTDYVGLPADLNPAAGSFSSVLGEADAGLEVFAFAGADLCSPCFDSGLQTGIPLRLPDGELVQGMVGSLDPGAATAKPEGRIAKYFSADGTHLVFGSKYAFEPGANSNGTDLTIYDRDLETGETQIVSTDTDGDAIKAGSGISQLDISSDGSRIVIGKRVSVDSSGNEYVTPLMHLGTSADSVELAPGTTSGVLYAGMSADGSHVFFTTKDKLLPAEDTDASADLYEAAVDAGGVVSLDLVSDSNGTSCSPAKTTGGDYWNALSGPACDALAIAGGGGVAADTGVVYFLSPEQLDGSEGTANQPNLYRAEPGGEAEFIATLEPDNPLLANSVKAVATRQTGDFQIDGIGRFTVFRSALPLTGVGTFEKLTIFRHDAEAGDLSCVSCEFTGTTDSSLVSDSELAPNGLSLVDDGRVFFTTLTALALRDANERQDVYTWSGDGVPSPISAGSGPFDSALLTVSADGTDVFFYTHDALAPEEDHNASLLRIYDARAGGGFFKLPPEVPCAASDECHGPGTVAPPPPDIKSSGATTHGNVVTCAKNQVKRDGRCVRRKARGRKQKSRAKQRAKKRHGNTNGRRG